MRKELDEVTSRFLDLWYSKGFSKDGSWIAGCYALCQDMHENFGTSEEAFLKLIEFTEAAETEEEVIEKIERLASIKKTDI